MVRRVPVWVGFVAASVVVFLTICFYYAYTRSHRTVSGNAAGFPVDSAALQQSTDPEALLGIADHFYWLNNGPAAAPLYARAEQLFSERDDARNYNSPPICQRIPNRLLQILQWFRGRTFLEVPELTTARTSDVLLCEMQLSVMHAESTRYELFGDCLRE